MKRVREVCGKQREYEKANGLPDLTPFYLRRWKRSYLRFVRYADKGKTKWNCYNSISLRKTQGAFTSKRMFEGKTLLLTLKNHNKQAI